MRLRVNSSRSAVVLVLLLLVSGAVLPLVVAIARLVIDSEPLQLELQGPVCWKKINSNQVIHHYQATP